MAQMKQAVFVEEPSVYNQPKVKEENFSVKDIINGAVRRNITGAEMLMNQNATKGIPDPKFSFADKESEDLFSKYKVDQVLFDDTEDIYSHFDLEQRLKSHQQRDVDAKAVASLGTAGQIGTELGVGLFSPADWLIGGIVGKGAKAIGTATKLGSTGEKFLSAGAGAVAGVGSVAALEASTTGDIDPTNAIIAGTLGSTIGYVTGRGFVNNPNTLGKISDLATNGIDPSSNNITWYPKESYAMPFMHNSADLLKTSDNVVARGAGFKAVRSPDGRISQTWDTIDDLKRVNDSAAVETIKDVNDLRNNFKSTTGREFTEADEKAIMRHGNDIDYKYNEAKDADVRSQQDLDIQARVNQHNDSFNQRSQEIDSAYVSNIEDIVARDYTPELELTLKDSGLSETIDDLNIKKSDLEKRVTELEKSEADALSIYKQEKTDQYNQQIAELDAEYKTHKSEALAAIRNTAEEKLSSLKAKSNIDGLELKLKELKSALEDATKLGKTSIDGIITNKNRKAREALVNRLSKSIEDTSSKIEKQKAMYEAKGSALLEKYDDLLAKENDRLDSIYEKADTILLNANKKEMARAKAPKPSKEVVDELREAKKELARIERDTAEGSTYLKRRDAIVKKFQDAVDKEAKNIKSSYTKEIEKLRKEQAKAVKESQGYKHTPEEIAQFVERSQVSVSKQIGKIMDSIPAEYRPFIERINKFHQYYGDKINTANLDGISGLDLTYYWSRGYDTKKILENEAGAIQAFSNAIAHNFEEVTPALQQKIEEMAQRIVRDMVQTSQVRETFGVPNKVRGKFIDDLNKIGKLKGRSLRLNASELVDFMDSSLDSYLTSYHGDMNGRLAVKEIFGIDSLNKPEDFALKNGFSQEDSKLFSDVVDSALNKSMLDPKSTSMSSKILRGLRSANFINFGGWFAPTTLIDLSNIVNDLGLSRTAKYFAKDIGGAFGSADEGSRKFAQYLGLGAHSLMNDRAMLAIGADAQHLSNSYDKALAKGTSFFSKYSGLNMVIDTMDRTAGMAATDFILTAKMDGFFMKNMNRFGLTADDVTALRNSKFAKFENGMLQDVEFEKLTPDLRYKFERAVRRAADDTVLKADEMDVPTWMKQAFSPAIAQTIFQFLRFPILAHNKIGRKMMANPNLINATASAAVGIGMLTLITQARDIGKEKKRFDLDTVDGQNNFAKTVIEYTPALGASSLIQMQYDVIGRMIAQARDTEYNSKGERDINMGVTIERLTKSAQSLRAILDGTANGKDASEGVRWISSNLFYINPFVNMMHDTIQENDEWMKDAQTWR